MGEIGWSVSLGRLIAGYCSTVIGCWKKNEFISSPLYLHGYMYPSIWECLTKPAIQFALSSHVIMKLLSFMISPHFLYFVLVPRTFFPVNWIFVLFIVYFQTVSFNVTVTMICATVDMRFMSHFGMWLLLPSQLLACGHCNEEDALLIGHQRSHWSLKRKFNIQCYNFLFMYFYCWRIFSNIVKQDKRSL